MYKHANLCHTHTPPTQWFFTFHALFPFPFETVIPSCSTNSISRAYPIPLVPPTGSTRLRPTLRQTLWGDYTTHTALGNPCTLLGSLLIKVNEKQTLNKEDKDVLCISDIITEPWATADSVWWVASGKDSSRQDEEGYPEINAKTLFNLFYQSAGCKCVKWRGL